MRLTIDVGNTNITLGLYDGEQRAHAWRLSTVHDRMPDEYGLQLLGLLEHVDCRVEQIDGCALASVVPPLNSTFLEACRRYEDPKHTWGADRVADAVAVRSLYGTPACVVDFGTATTFDAISAAGEYLGGAIAPGIDIAAETLFLWAAKLPRVDV